MSEKIILVWFRNNLRINDNEILFEAVRKADKILPVYCFDPYYYTKNDLGEPKTGNIRAKFILQSVSDLKTNLKNIGGDLIIRTGDPSAVITQLAAEYNVTEVYHHREVAYEETKKSEEVEAALWKIKLNLKHFIGHTLYHKEDLPFPIKDIPDSFAVFKKKVERDSNVRPCVKSPEKMSIPEISDAGELPSMAELGLEEPIDDARAVVYFKGGESEAINRLKQLEASNFCSALNKNLRNVSPSAHSSSMLSPWIALGCISLRQVYHEIVTHQQTFENQDGSAILLDLLWRDYFRFMFKKHGQKFIAARDLKEDGKSANAGEAKCFENWKNGETGTPAIDAIMHELSTTGYINNYSRQTTADFFVNTLKLNWTKGAAYFEEKLIDYSPASNWGNWAFVAGVNGARDSKYNILTKKTSPGDMKNDYIDTWLPMPKLAHF